MTGSTASKKRATLIDEHDAGFEEIGLARRRSDEYVEETRFEYGFVIAAEKGQFARR